MRTSRASKVASIVIVAVAAALILTGLGIVLADRLVAGVFGALLGE